MTTAEWDTIRNFKPDEFNRPDEMQLGLLQRLDLARDHAGVPFRVTFNAVRTEDENAAVPGAAKDSAHLRGWAVDLDPPDSHARERYLYGLVMAGFTRYSPRYADGHVHADCDPSLPPEVVW